MRIQIFTGKSFTDTYTGGGYVNGKYQGSMQDPSPYFHQPLRYNAHDLPYHSFHGPPRDHHPHHHHNNQHHYSRDAEHLHNATRQYDTNGAYDPSAHHKLLDAMSHGYDPTSDRHNDRPTQLQLMPGEEPIDHDSHHRHRRIRLA